MRRLRASQGEALAGAAQIAAYGGAGFALCLVGNLALLGLDRLLPATGVAAPTVLLTHAFVTYLLTQWALWRAAERYLRPDEPFAVAVWVTFLGTAAALTVALLLGRLLPGWQPDRLVSLLPVYLVAPVFSGIVLQVASGGSLRLPALARRRRREAVTAPPEHQETAAAVPQAREDELPGEPPAADEPEPGGDRGAPH